MRAHCPTILAAALLAGCTIAPPPAPPDLVQQASLREEGQVALPDAAQAAFCASQDLPETLVLLLEDGAAVRPAEGLAGPRQPPYAMMLTQAEEGVVAWRLLVAEPGPSGPDLMLRLRAVLANCLARLGRTT